MLQVVLLRFTRLRCAMLLSFSLTVFRHELKIVFKRRAVYVVCVVWPLMIVKTKSTMVSR